MPVLVLYATARRDPRMSSVKMLMISPRECLFGITEVFFMSVEVGDYSLLGAARHTCRVRLFGEGTFKPKAGELRNSLGITPYGISGRSTTVVCLGFVR